MNQQGVSSIGVIVISRIENLIYKTINYRMENISVLKMNNLLNVSLIKLVQASSGSTASADNQLIGTIMIGVGVVVILISVLVLISRFKSSGNGASKEVETTTTILKPVANTPSVSPSNLPQGLPPIDQLQPKTTPTQTLPPVPTTPVPSTTTTTTTTTTPAQELPKTFPNVPLSELASSTATEKSYSLEEIEKSEPTTPPPAPVGV